MRVRHWYMMWVMSHTWRTSYVACATSHSHFLHFPKQGRLYVRNAENLSRRFIGKWIIYNLQSCQNAPHVQKIINLISLTCLLSFYYYKVKSSRKDEMRNVTGIFFTRVLCYAYRHLLYRISPSFSYRAEKIFAITWILCRTIRECDFGRFAPICHVKMRIFHFYKSQARTNAYLVRLRETMQYNCTAPIGRSYLSYLSLSHLGIGRSTRHSVPD